MATSGFSPDLDTGSSVSSLVSPIRYGTDYPRSLDSWVSSNRTNGSGSIYQDPQGEDAQSERPPTEEPPVRGPPAAEPAYEQRSVRGVLAGSSGSSAVSSDANSARSLLSPDSGSPVSGTTIYSDAREVGDGEDRDQPGTRSQSLGPELVVRQTSERASTPGLVSVTPLRSSLRDSFLALDASDLDVRRVANPSLPQGNSEASTTSFMQSPSTPTPRLRRDPRLRKPQPAVESIPAGSNIHEILIEPKNPVGGAAPPESPGSLGSPTRPPAQQLAAGANRDVPALHVLSTRGIRMILGKPRAPSEDGSHAPTHASSQADSNGHIEPSRKVNEVPLSYIRRAGAMIYTNSPIYAGIPRLPMIPVSGCVLSKEGSALLGENSPRDVWGRKQASTTTAVCLLLLCTAFPPLWLLMGTGYFDHLAGPIPRLIKLVALGLSLAILAAATSLVIVFSILKD